METGFGCVEGRRDDRIENFRGKAHGHLQAPDGLDHAGEVDGDHFQGEGHFGDEDLQEISKREFEGETMKVGDLLEALDAVTGGRCLREGQASAGRGNPFVVTKSSGIPGKECTERPGLVYGDPDAPLKKIAVVMTLTESSIELAAATGIDAIVAHHPVADGASCGGVTLRNYLSLYGISLFELHEAFHGLHPGIARIHGHRVFKTDIAFGGIPGNVLLVGRAMEGIDTLGDVARRIETFAGVDEERLLLAAERLIRGSPAIEEASLASAGKILLGDPGDHVGTILHIFPHTGFSVEHLAMAKAEHSEADTVIVSISRLSLESPIVRAGAELGLHFVLGNPHPLEILENGLPLAVAIQRLLPEAEVFVFRERVTSTPLAAAGSAAVREYAEMMAGQFLIPPRNTPDHSMKGRER